MGTVQERTSFADPAAQVADEVAMMLRLGDRNRRSAELDGTLERSAYLVLSVLEAHGPANINCIAERLRLDASTVTRQVVGMECGGLVVRGKDPHDGRATIVRMTEHGRAERARAEKARGALYQAVLQDWDEDERAQLARCLHRLNVAMDAHLGHGSPHL